MSVSTPGLAPDAESRLSRALLRAGRHEAVVQDRIDAAECANTAGARDIATMLYGLVALEIGFSSRSLAFLQEVNARTGLWADLPRDGAESSGGFSIDLALGELRRLMRFKARLQPLPSSLEGFLPAEISIGLQRARGPDPVLRDLASRVGEALRMVPLTTRNGGLAPLLAPLVDPVLALAPTHVEHYVDAGWDTIAHMLMLEGVRRFLLRNADLLSARPVEMFDEVAALDPGALGPFFSNVRMLLRGTSDLFALVDVAAGGRADDATLECWTVLLAADLPDDRLASLAAEMGDRGMAAGLGRLLVKVARRGGDSRPLGVVQSIRDASLDIDAWDVAGDAQQLIAQWRRAEGDEWRRLGEIRGYDGNTSKAKAALQRALEMNPEDQLAARLLLAVEADGGIAFEELSMSRRRLRRARVKAFNSEYAGGSV